MAVNGPIVRRVGSVLRKLGQTVDAMGVGLQEKHAYVEKCEFLGWQTALGSPVRRRTAPVRNKSTL